ncbi:MAG: hypothetical protein QF733_03970 [Phycisphaerales bacterium]|jgi:hypothetical protein|nr:hypothetical protein [Phycisphaerales bacterium]
MAIRSSAGNGVIISLIVFVLLTILLIATSILLYGKWDGEREAAATARADLDRIATKAERASDWYQQLKDSKGRDSILQALQNRHEATWQFAVGRSTGDVDAAREELGLTENASLAGSINEMRRRISDLEAANAALQAGAQEATRMQEQLAADLAAANQGHADLLAAEANQLKPYADADQRHRDAIDQVTSDFEDRQASLRDQKDATIESQRDEIDRLTATNKRLSAAQAKTDAERDRARVSGANPAALVDGSVLDVVGGGDLVYIDRGRRDQIVLGMTFEVFDNAAQIQSAAEEDDSRGKASIQVVKIGEASSTAKVTRGTVSRPILPGNVLANAVYDPDYTFKFLVHGKFDVDHDGLPSEEEAEYLRERIRNWGGDIVKGEELPGDLDFLVLGAEPLAPIKPSTQASTQVMNEYRRLRTMVDQYQTLLEQARQAKIPVLNQNRLEILTGRTDL